MQWDLESKSSKGKPNEGKKVNDKKGDLSKFAIKIVRKIQINMPIDQTL